MGWLHHKSPQGIDPYGATPGAPGVSAPVRAEAFLDFVGINPTLYPSPAFPATADTGFEKNELVYACIMAKATSLPDAPLRVFGPDGMGQPLENHPLRQLIVSPNPAVSEYELMELTSIYLDLAGIAFWEIVRGRGGEVVELWPLRPDLVRIMPRRDGNHRYGYVVQGGLVDLGTDVLAFKMPSPTEPWLGQAPMRAANRAVALDNEATDFVKALLQNHAVPGTVIETEQRIDDQLTERLTAKWVDRFGATNRGRPAFLQKGMKVHSVGLDLTALEFPDLRTISESRICMSFGVPPIIVGAKVGLDRSTFANFSEARTSFWEETLMPIQKRIQGVIGSRLLPLVQGPKPRRVTVRFDNSQVRALRESEGKRWELATQALRAGGITLNEFCRYVGLPEKGPDGDVYLFPAGVAPADLTGKPLYIPEPVQQPPAPAADSAEGDSGDNAEEGDDNGSAKAIDPPKAEHRTVDWFNVEETAKAVTDVVERQQADLVEDMRLHRVHLHTRKYAPPSDIETEWVDQLVRALDLDDDAAVRGYVAETVKAVRSAMREADPETAVEIAFLEATGSRALALAQQIKDVPSRTLRLVTEGN